jgi:hypothetical protein
MPAIAPPESDDVEPFPAVAVVAEVAVEIGTDDVDEELVVDAEVELEVEEAEVVDAWVELETDAEEASDWE